MPGKHYRTEDFLLDDHFQQWVKNPDSENNAYWQEFLRVHPEALEEVEKAKKLIVQLNFYVEPRSDATKDRIKSAIDETIQEGALSQPMYPHRDIGVSKQAVSLLHRPGFRVAATITGLMLLVSAYLTFFSSKSYTEYATEYGETKTIVLPDHSLVTLNANSLLKVEEDRWDDLSEREVWLTGEAFFDVEKKKTTKNDLAKFVVHTGKVQVEVVGTRFNVSTRRSATKVVLSSGKVILNIQQDAAHDPEEVMMEPGELVGIVEHRRAIERKRVDPAHYTAWTENKLVFDHTPLAAITQLIEDNYGIRVVLENPALLKKEFTGAAPADALEILLGKLSVVYNLEIIRNGNEMILKEKQTHKILETI